MYVAILLSLSLVRGFGEWMCDRLLGSLASDAIFLFPSSAPASEPPLAAVPFGQTRASVWLDLLRGVAALLVLGEHWRNIFFVDYRQLPHKRLLWAPMYLLTAAGHQAVVIFFVLSGFLISGSIFRMLAGGRWNATRYAIHRLVRLWVVLLPGLVLCAVLDACGVWLHRAPGLYGGRELGHQTTDVMPLLTWKVFFGNLFFVQGIRVPTFGSDGSLWSLSYEFWFYVLFPLAVFVLLGVSLWRRLLCGLLFMVCAWFAGSHVFYAFPIWLLGVPVAHLRAPDFSRWARATTTVFYFVLVFLAARMPLWAGWPADVLVGCATALFIWVLLTDRAEARPRAQGTRASRALARFSYTLYVVHTPILVFLASLMVHDERWQPTMWHLCLGLFSLAATLTLSYGIASVTEFRTDRVRHMVEQFFV